MRVNELTIRIDSHVPNYPKVRLLIDGEDLLASTGADEGNDPADILDSGALLPQDPPRRIAFYGCACGEFGCANVAGLVVRRDHHVEWADFRTLTGIYHSALPEAGDGPDPLTRIEREWHRSLDLPTLTFERERYLAVVRAATADRSWETRPRAVIRHLKTLRPETTHWAGREGDRITIHHRVGRMPWSTDLLVPPGPPDVLAARLVALLDEDVDPRRIAAEGLWT